MNKEELCLGVGILSILFAVMIFCYMGISSGFCNLQESCEYIPYEPLQIFMACLFSIGALLMFIGFIIDQIKMHTTFVKEKEGEQ
jgi:uncharacterized membrane protein